MKRIHLDHISATPLLPEAKEAMMPWISERFGAPASLHCLGVDARDAVEVAREQVAGFVNAGETEQIVFTSGGTETVNLAVKGAAWGNRRFGNHIVTGAIEHPAILRSIEFLETQGFESTRVPVNRQGLVAPEAIAEAMRKETILVCLHHANHDLGTIQPLRKISEITSEKGVPFFVDATASGGWLEVNAKTLGADLIALAPHRFYGPKGVGVLYRNRRVQLEPLIHGGGQEHELRAGTENVMAIVGAGVAAEAATGDLAFRQACVTNLQKLLWRRLKDTMPGIQLNGPAPGPSRLPNHLSLSAEGVEGEGLALMLDVRGITIHAGAACIIKSTAMPPALEAIGLSLEMARATTLITLGKDNTPEEIEKAAAAFAEVTMKLRSLSGLQEGA